MARIQKSVSERRKGVGVHDLKPGSNVTASWRLSHDDGNSGRYALLTPNSGYHQPMELERGGPTVQPMTRLCQLGDALDAARAAGTNQLDLPPFSYTVSGMYAHIDATQLSRYIEDYATREGLTTYRVDARVQTPFLVTMSITLGGQASKLVPLLQWLDGLTKG